MKVAALKVGVIGLGQMGQGIAANLDRAGLLNSAHDLDQTAWDMAQLSKTVANISGQAMVDQADVILLAVPSTEEVETALNNCKTTTNTLIVDLTTSDPEQSKQLAHDLKGRGFTYLDAAMTGGAAGADAGTLTLMVGGDPANVSRCQPLFHTIASKVFHLGPVGAGHAMKLIHNLILHSSFMATCEGLSLADRAGLDLTKAVDVLNAGNARSFVTETRFPRDILSGTMNARSVVGNLAKDLALAVDFATKQNGPAPYSTLTHSLLNEALKQGHGTTDFSHLFALFEEITQSMERNK